MLLMQLQNCSQNCSEVLHSLLCSLGTCQSAALFTIPRTVLRYYFETYALPRTVLRHYSQTLVIHAKYFLSSSNIFGILIISTTQPKHNIWTSTFVFVIIKTLHKDRVNTLFGICSHLLERLSFFSWYYSYHQQELFLTFLLPYLYQWDAPITSNNFIKQS